MLRIKDSSPINLATAKAAPKLSSLAELMRPESQAISSGFPSFIKGLAAKAKYSDTLGTKTFSEADLIFAETYDATEKLTYSCLREDHPLNSELRELLTETMEYLGMNPQLVSLEIVEQYNSADLEAETMGEVEAFTNPVTKRVTISKSLLELLDYRKDLIRAVIAHELAHHIKPRQSNGEAFDPFANRLRSYEEEYSSDRVASFTNAAFDEDPTAISEVLTKLEQYSPDDAYYTELNSLSIAESHPYSQRRKRANRHLARKLIKDSQNFSQVQLKSRVEDSDMYLFNHKAGSRNKTLNARYGINAVARTDHQLRFELSADWTFKDSGFHLEQAKSDEAITPYYMEELPDAEDLIEADDSGYQIWLDQALVLLTDGLKSDAIEFLADDIARFSKTDLEFIFENLNVKNLADEDIQNLSEYFDTRISADLAVWRECAPLLTSMLFNRWAELEFTDPNSLQQSEKAALLRNFVYKLSANERKHGVNTAWRSSVDALELALDLFYNPKSSLEDKKALFEIADYNPALFLDIVERNKRFLTEASTAAQKQKTLLQDMLDFATENNLDFALRSKLTKTKLEEAIVKHSPVRLVELATTPQVRAILCKTENKNSIEHEYLDESSLEFRVRFSAASGFDEQDFAKYVESHLKKGWGYLSQEGSPASLVLNATELDNLVSSKGWATEVKKAVEKLDQGHQLKTLDEKKEFLQEKLKQIDTTANLSQKILLMRSASLNKAKDAWISSDLKDYELIHGQDKLIEEYLGYGRNNYTKRSYADIEKEVFLMLQLWSLWDECFAEDYKQMPEGKAKVDFLLKTQPVKSLRRDQMMLAAVDYPSLETWQDQVAVKEALKNEKDLELLLKLRDNLLNEIFVNYIQNILFDNFQSFSDLELFKTGSGDLVELLKKEPEFEKDQELMRILLCYHTKSSRRDELLKEVIDRQDSKRKKQLLSSLTTEPDFLDFQDGRSAIEVLEKESFLDIVSRFEAQDKAEVLLFFLGKRKFQTKLRDLCALALNPSCKGFVVQMSNINIAELGDDLAVQKAVLAAKQKGVEEIVSIASLDKALIEATTGLKLKMDEAFLDYDEEFDYEQHLVSNVEDHLEFIKPDALVRLLKAAGMDEEVLQDSLDSVSSEQDQLDSLHQIVIGENGILSDPAAADYFFKEAAETIVETSKTDLGSSKEAVKGLIDFALRNCPEQKLPMMFKAVWTLAREENVSLPVLTRKILQVLGPAFIKFGQKLATRNIPADFKEEFRKLSSENSVADTSFFYYYMDSSFDGESPYDENHSGRKVAEGSMAACYEAQVLPETELELRTSPEKRAVKVIHPFINDEIEQDVSFITKLVDYINDHSADFNGLTIPVNTTEIIKRRLLEQASPDLEIAKADLLKKNLKRDYGDIQFLPVEIDKARSKGLVISSQYRPGLELDNEVINQLGLNSQKIRNKVAYETLRQILQEDAYQSDTNLGNFGLWVDESAKPVLDAKSRAQVIWYDSGAIEPFAEKDQVLLLTLIKSIAKASDDLPKILAEMIKPESLGESNDIQKLEAYIRQWLGAQQKNAKTIEIDAIKNIFESFVDFVGEKKLELEDKWVSLGDTLSMLAPLLEGSDPAVIKGIVVASLKKKNMLSAAEKLALNFGLGA